MLQQANPAESYCVLLVAGAGDYRSPTSLLVIQVVKLEIVVIIVEPVIPNLA